MTEERKGGQWDTKRAKQNVQVEGVWGRGKPTWGLCQLASLRSGGEGR